MKAFHPVPQSTKSVSASTTSGSVAFDLTIMGSGGVDILVTNPGTTLAFVDFGSGSAPTASAVDTPIPAGSSRVLRVNNPDSAPLTHAAAVMASGTATIYFTPGQGGV
jgi:hypothetical protein